MSANDRQVAGSHYSAEIQHWDYAASHEFDYFQGQITKYVTRWKKKNGLQDLLKAQHFLEKYIELEKAKREKLKENTTIDFSNFPGIDTSQPQPNGYVNKEKVDDTAADLNRVKINNYFRNISETFLTDRQFRDRIPGTVNFSSLYGRDTSQPQPNGYVNQDGQTAVKYEYKPFATDKG